MKRLRLLSAPSQFSPLTLALTLLISNLALTGCVLDAGARVETETRELSRTFPLAEGETLRLANLAGTVELVEGEGDEVVVLATLHASARNENETLRLLDEMEWVEDRSRSGDPQWALSYPVERHRRFHFNDKGWGESRIRYRGKKVTVTSRKKPSTPTLYADLTIQIPESGKLVVRNSLGDVSGDDLKGSLVVDTGSGDVQLRSFSGTLTVDTGSGDVDLGPLRGEIVVDTGSGDIRIADLVGNGELDTGSGDVLVRKIGVGRLSVDTGSGNVQVADGTVGELKADTGSGDVQVLDVDVARLLADTGSGDVVLRGPLASAENLALSTGSGDVKLQVTADAAFDLDYDGNGDLVVRFDDVRLRSRGKELVGATRGAGGATIRVDTGSGDCVIGPA